MSELRFLSLNCRGLAGQEKRRDVVDFLKKSSCHIAFLQDTHMTDHIIPFFNTLWKGKSYHSFKTSNSRGSAILIKSTVPHEIIHEKTDPDGNFVLIVCKIRSVVYTMVSVYGPNEDNPSFYENLEECLETSSCENIIFGGDFNFVVDKEQDSNYLHDGNPNAKKKFLRMAQNYNLTDVWRYHHPSEQQFTWFRQNPLKYGRLDMFFVSNHLLSNISECQIVPGYRSDHCAISLTLTEPDQERGSYLWKFNESLLCDETYLRTIVQCIENVIEQYSTPVYAPDFITDPNNFHMIEFNIDIGLLYETLLMMIRGESVRYSKQKARARRQEEADIIREISEIQNNLAHQVSDNLVYQLEQSQNKLERLRASKIKGLITRSRVNWYDEGEKCSKFFLSLEKRNAQRKSIQCLKHGGRILSRKRDILKEFTNHLAHKYSATDDLLDARAYLQDNVTRTLSPEQKADLDKPITMAELTSALMTMNKGKSPGCNGFTAAFFKAFWKYLGPLLLRVLKQNISDGCLISSFREGVITLIPKTGKPADSVKGWRPISLLNVDFKIISAAITSRLKKVIGELISPVQSAYIKGRYIGENTRLVFDIIDYLNKTGKGGLVLAADFEAAFETVSWQYLLHALDCYNFGPFYKHLIKLVYLDANNFSRILLDGFLGDKIFLRRGIRQGDPISGYLFNLAVEPLAHQIINSSNLRGIKMYDDLEIRVSQYADDLIAFLRPDNRSLNGAIYELQTFSSFSGLRVNIEKTKCLPVGPMENLDVDTHNISFVDEMKILGITFNRSNHDITNKNIEYKMSLISNDIAQWNRRHLTVIGKVTVIKSLLLAKLVHIFISLPDPPAKMIKSIESVLFRFLWKNRSDQVKRTKVVQGYGQDGLQMVDLSSFIKSMKVGWMKRLYTSQNEWALLFKQSVPPPLFMYGSEKIKKLSSTITNSFWRDVLQAWEEFIRLYKPDVKNILTDRLWFSNFTKFKCSIVRHWDEKGLRFICDLINPLSGMIYAKHDLERLYNIRIDYLSYQSLIRSLPPDIRNANKCKLAEKPTIPYKLSLLSRKINTSRLAYQEFVTSFRSKYKDTQTVWRNKWIKDTGTVCEGTMFDIRIVTRNTFLQALHFKIISRIITTNLFLYIIGRNTTAACTFCSSSIETLEHIFWGCSRTQSFINELYRKLEIHFDLKVRFNKGEWFLPSLENLSKINILIITLAKLVLYKARNNARLPSVEHFLHCLRIEAEKELGSARKRSKITEFAEKWGNVQAVLQLNR